jgi:hypothetical protein
MLVSPRVEVAAEVATRVGAPHDVGLTDADFTADHASSSTLEPLLNLLVLGALDLSWREAASTVQDRVAYLVESADRHACTASSGRPDQACISSMTRRYRAVIRLWRNAWAEFIPFLDYDLEIRAVIRSTNAIESLNARYGRTVKPRGHFPTEQAAMKCLYLVTRSLDPKGTCQTRWAVRWKPAITFADRMPAAEDR